MTPNAPALSSDAQHNVEAVAAFHQSFSAMVREAMKSGGDRAHPMVISQAPDFARAFLELGRTSGLRLDVQKDGLKVLAEILVAAGLDSAQAVFAMHFQATLAQAALDRTWENGHKTTPSLGRTPQIAAEMQARVAAIVAAATPEKKKPVAAPKPAPEAPAAAPAQQATPPPIEVVPAV